MMPLNDEQKLKIRIAIAERMGWQRYDADSAWNDESGWTPPGASPPNDYVNLPNPFDSAADKDALVEWVASERKRSFEFYCSLADELIIDSDAIVPFEVTIKFMAAPREAIILAACKALGIIINEDQLPDSITDAQYDIWYASSWLQDGILLGFTLKALGIEVEAEKAMEVGA